MKNIQIAEMLKISPATVSLALNNRPGVSEETRRKVLELRNSLIQNDLDSIERSRNIGTIGLLVYKSKNGIISETPFFVQLIDAFSDFCESLGFSLSLLYSSAETDTEIIEKIKPLKLDGLVIIATEMTSENVRFFQNNMTIPFVMADAYFPDCDVDTVVMNNAAGVIKAVRYAYDMGHRQIGFLSTEKTCNNFSDRLRAYLNEIERLGLIRDDGIIFKMPLSIDEAKERMLGYIKENAKLPSILIADNDRAAMGVLGALKEAGYKVPDDISLIGYDDMPMVQYVEPALTSIGLHQQTIARLAIDRLVKKINDPKENTYTIQQLVEVTLIERESVKKI